MTECLLCVYRDSDSDSSVPGDRPGTAVPQPRPADTGPQEVTVWLVGGRTTGTIPSDTCGDKGLLLLLACMMVFGE